MAVKTSKKEKAALDEIVTLLEEHEQLTEKAEKLMGKHGISKMLADAAELKKKATELTVAAEFKSILMPSGARYDVRQDAYNKRVVGDEDDLAEVKNPAAVIPLKVIIKKKFGKNGWKEFWQSVTSRKVDVAKLEEAVKEGKITVDEISPAYYHDLKSPYLRRYE